MASEAQKKSLSFFLAKSLFTRYTIRYHHTYQVHHSLHLYIDRVEGLPCIVILYFLDRVDTTLCLNNCSNLRLAMRSIDTISCHGTSSHSLEQRMQQEKA